MPQGSERAGLTDRRIDAERPFVARRAGELPRMQSVRNATIIANRQKRRRAGKIAADIGKGRRGNPFKGMFD